jgi:hypothetical protein
MSKFFSTNCLFTICICIASLYTVIHLLKRGSGRDDDVVFVQNHHSQRGNSVRRMQTLVGSW